MPLTFQFGHGLLLLCNTLIILLCSFFCRSPAKLEAMLIKVMKMVAPDLESWVVPLYKRFVASMNVFLDDALAAMSSKIVFILDS